MRTRNNHTWKNSLKNQRVTAEIYFEPENLNDLAEIVQKAEQNNKRVRAVGSGHSFSDIALCKYYLVNPHKISFVKDVDRSTLTAAGQQLKLVDAGAGTTIKDFNKELDDRDEAIINMGGIDNQTLSGAISTGTHGSGIDLPAVSGMVKSVLLVAEGGKRFRIEPANGITDPAKHDNSSKIRLIQDDPTFNSVVVGLGAMGLVHSYILEVRDMYWIEESRKLSSWKTVKAQLLDPARPLFQGYRGVMIRINPHKKVKKRKPEKEDHTVLIIQHKEHLEKPRHRTIDEATRNIVSAAGGVIAPALLQFYKAFPGSVYMPKMVETSMTTAVDDEYVNRAHKVLFLGQKHTKELGYDAEFAFDMKDTKYIDVIEDIIKVAKEMANKKLYHSGQIGLRFVKRSGQFLTPEYGKDVCYVDTSFLYGFKGDKEILDAYQEVFFKHGGIPHWGKINNRLEPRLDLIPKMYPRLDGWQTVARRLNPHGTFDNRFTDRFKLLPPPNQAPLNA